MLESRLACARGIKAAGYLFQGESMKRLLLNMMIIALLPLLCSAAAERRNKMPIKLPLVEFHVAQAMCSWKKKAPYTILYKNVSSWRIYNEVHKKLVYYKERGTKAKELLDRLSRCSNKTSRDKYLGSLSTTFEEAFNDKGKKILRSAWDQISKDKPLAQNLYCILAAMVSVPEASEPPEYIDYDETKNGVIYWLTRFGKENYLHLFEGDSGVVHKGKNYFSVVQGAELNYQLLLGSLVELYGRGFSGSHGRIKWYTWPPRSVVRSDCKNKVLDRSRSLKEGFTLFLFPKEEIESVCQRVCKDLTRSNSRRRRCWRKCWCTS